MALLVALHHLHHVLLLLLVAGRVVAGVPRRLWLLIVTILVLPRVRDMCTILVTLWLRVLLISLKLVHNNNKRRQLMHQLPYRIQI